MKHTLGPFTADELRGLRSVCGDAIDAFRECALKGTSCWDMDSAASALSILLLELNRIAKATPQS